MEYSPSGFHTDSGFSCPYLVLEKGCIPEIDSNCSNIFKFENIGKERILINNKNEIDNNTSTFSTSSETKRKNRNNLISDVFIKNSDISFNECDFEKENKLKNHLEMILNNNEKEMPKFKVKVEAKKRENIYTRKYDKDNIKTKLNINYSNFYTIVINSSIKARLNQIGREKEFINFKFTPINHILKRKTSKKDLEKFQILTIGDVMKSDFTQKSKALNSNKDIYNKIQDDEDLKVISKILEKNYLFFFDKLFLKKRYIFNLNEFGFKEDLEIKLPKDILFYEDLLEKNKKLEFFGKYKTTMNFCCRNNFKIKNNKYIPIFTTRKMKRK